jgi:hypothetical protein
MVSVRIRVDMLYYKYFSPKRKAFLNELLIRFTPPGLFNDPFDSLPAFSNFDESLINEKVDKVGLDIAFDLPYDPSPEPVKRAKLHLLSEANAILKKAYLSNPSVLDEVFETLHRKRINSEIGILCCSETRQSVIMWSHYADEHKGFVVGFESTDSFFSHYPHEPPDIGVLRRVTYTQERTIIDIRNIREDAQLPEFLFTKNQDWSYEKEWRIIRLLQDAVEIRNSDVYLVAVPPSAVRQVIIGCHADPQMADELRNAQMKNSALSHVEFLRARLSKRRYEMDILPWT